MKLEVGARLEIKTKQGGGGTERGGLIGSGGLETSEEELVGLGVVGGDNFQRTGSAGEFAEGAFGDEVINMLGDSRD